MQKLLLPALALTLLVGDALAQRRGGRRGRDRDPQSVELKHFTFKTVSFAAPSLERGEATYAIYLPAGYDAEENADRTYPWVVWLHGMNGSHTRFHSAGGAKVLDELRGADKIPAMILVAPAAPRRTAYANGEGAGDIEDLVLKDLVGHVTDNFRVSSERHERAIMGVSIGGMGAMRMALKNPDTFGTLATHSMAMFPPDPDKLEGRYAQRIPQMIQFMGLSEVFGDPIDKDKWASYVPSAMIAKMKPADVKGLRIYFDAGTDDRYGFGPPNQMLHETMKEAGFEHEFEYVDGGGHAWGSGATQRQLVKSLQFVAAGFTKSAKPGSDGKDSKDAGAAAGTRRSDK